jgi:hypothetical protein
MNKSSGSGPYRSASPLTCQTIYFACPIAFANVSGWNSTAEPGHDVTDWHIGGHFDACEISAGRVQPAGEKRTVGSAAARSDASVPVDVGHILSTAPGYFPGNTFSISGRFKERHTAGIRDWLAIR